ncbi:MAG: MliC family protein [Leptolyngbyaceae cyanobacterium]
MKNQSFRVSAGLLTSFCLLGCNTDTNTATGQGSLVTYQCKGGTEFTARLSPNEAVADLPDRPNLALPLVESDSGTTYSDGSTKLLIDGEKAVVEVNNAIILTECTLAESGSSSETAAAPTAESSSSAPPSNSGPVSSQPSSDGIPKQRVQFQPGATSATVEATIVGYNTIDYVLNAQAGQYANISMATDNTANYFNILPPGSNDEAIFNGSINGNQYEGSLPETGDYKVRVYLMRSAARREEAANYRLEMIISGGGNAGASSSPGDAIVPGTSYNATGAIACAMTPAEANGECPFGVVREGNGSGYVDITTQYGNTFTVYFENGNPVQVEGGSGAFSSTRQGDRVFLNIGEERYVLFDAIIYGG